MDCEFAGLLLSADRFAFEAIEGARRDYTLAIQENDQAALRHLLGEVEALLKPRRAVVEVEID